MGHAYLGPLDVSLDDDDSVSRDVSVSSLSNALRENSGRSTLCAPDMSEERSRCARDEISFYVSLRRFFTSRGGVCGLTTSMLDETAVPHQKSTHVIFTKVFNVQRSTAAMRADFKVSVDLKSISH